MKFINWLKKPQGLISLSAIGFSALVGFVALLILHVYESTQPIWVEQAAYGQWPMVIFLSLIKQQGLLSAIQKTLTTSFILQNRHLLQIWMLGILAPSLLGNFNAPLFVVLPMFSVFLGLFGWTVYKRTDHIGYSIASMLFFCALAQLTRHNWGIGSGFADWQSMFLLSAATLCLINGVMKPQLGWVRAFAAFLALAILARSTAVFYAVIICGPILVVYLLRQYDMMHSFRPVVLTLVNVLTITFPAIVIILIQLSSLLTYYGSSNAWQLKQPFSVSASNIFIGLLKPFMGIPLITVCIILLVLSIFRTILRDRPGCAHRNPLLKERGTSDKLSFEGSHGGRAELKTRFAILWWGLGFLVFLLYKGYTSDVPKEVMYMAPPFLLGSVSLFSFNGQCRPKSFNLLALCVVMFSMINLGWNSWKNLKFASLVNVESQTRRQAQREIAEVISTQPEGITWQSYTSVDWGIPVSLITQYEFRRFRMYGGADFYNRKNYWDTWYPGLSLSQLQEQLYAKTADCVDVVVILQDPQKQPKEMEDYSYSLAAFIAKHVLSDPRWRFLREMDGWPLGTRYGIYENTKATHSNACASK